MSHPQAGNIDFYITQLQPIVNGRIVKPVTDEDGYIGLMIEKDNQQYILWLLSDDEGNAAGSFELNKFNGQ